MDISRLWVGSIVAVVGLAGCSDLAAPSPTPAPVSTADAVAPSAFVLTHRQVAAYTRQTTVAVTAALLADQDQDPAIVGQLKTEGFTKGSRSVYIENPHGAVTPFLSVAAQVLFFHETKGASAFVTQETSRRFQAPTQGTLAPLMGIPSGGMDTVVGGVQTAPASADQFAQTAYFAVMRKGRTVATLFAVGNVSPTLQAEFVALLTMQEQDMALNPDA